MTGYAALQSLCQAFGLDLREVRAVHTEAEWNQEQGGDVSRIRFEVRDGERVFTLGEPIRVAA